MQHPITVMAFCHHHHIDTSFVHQLHEQGLLAVKTDADQEWLDAEDLHTAERLVRLHYDLDVNLEGLDVIHHLLQRMEDLQRELAHVRNRLRFYEEGERNA